MYAVGRAIAQVMNESLPQTKVNISASNGSVANVENLESGQIDLGLVSGDVAYWAYCGQEDFSGAAMDNLRAVGAVYFSYSNWIAKADQEVEYVHDLLGKRVSVGPETSSTELSSHVVLDAVGLNDDNTLLQNYGLGSGCMALKNGTMDAVHGFAGIPVAAMEDLAQAVPCRLLRYTEEELGRIITDNKQYLRATIPAGTYHGQTEDVPSFGVKCLLCVSADMDEDLVYTIAGILQQSAKDLSGLQNAMSAMENSDFLCQNLPIPLHPGAERYYQDAGLK